MVVVHVHVDLDHGGACPAGVDGHGRLQAEALGQWELPQQCGPNGPLPGQGSPDIGARGPADARPGQAPHQAHTAAAPGGGQHGDDEVGVALQYGNEQALGEAGAGAHVGVDEEVDAGLRGGGHTGSNGATLSHVGRQAEHSCACL